MALPQQIQVKNRTYTVVHDVTLVYRALITGVVRDEITGEPPRSRFALQVESGKMNLKTLEEGLFCIAGYVEQVFPDISTTSYSVDVVITAPGYREARFTVTIPTNASFPIGVPNVVLLRPIPVRLQGRVVADTTDRPPISGAKIVTVNPAAATEHVVALRTPLQFRHDKDTPVRRLTPTGASKKLVTQALASTQILTLTNRTGLAPGRILRIALTPDHQVEFGVVDDPGPAPLGNPGDVALRSPLRHTYPQDTLVRRLMPAALIGKLSREGDAGDGVLLLDSAVTVDDIEISDPPHEEYRAVGAVTNAEGFYQLDGVGRVRTVQWQASAAGFTTPSIPVPWTVNFEQPVNVINFRLNP